MSTLPIANPDSTTLINLTPNLDIGDIADPALRLAAFQYIYSFLQTLTDAVNTDASSSSAGNMSVLDKLKLNSIITTTMPITAIPIDTEWAIGNFKQINVSTTGAFELREY